MHPGHGPCHSLSLPIVRLHKVEIREHPGKTRLHAQECGAAIFQLCFFLRSLLLRLHRWSGKKLIQRLNVQGRPSHSPLAPFCTTLEP